MHYRRNIPNNSNTKSKMGVAIGTDMSIYNNILDEKLFIKFNDEGFIIGSPTSIDGLKDFRKIMRFTCVLVIFNFLNVKSLSENIIWSSVLNISLQYKIPVIYLVDPNNNGLIYELRKIKTINKGNENLVFIHRDEDFRKIFRLEEEKDFAGIGNFVHITELSESLIEQDGDQNDDSNRKSHRIALAKRWEKTYKDYGAVQI